MRQIISKTSVVKSKIHGRRILDPRGRVTFVRSVAVVCAERTLVSLEAEFDAFRAMAKAVASRVQDRESQLVARDTSVGLVSPQAKRSTSSRVLFPDQENTTTNSSMSYAQ